MKRAAISFLVCLMTICTFLPVHAMGQPYVNSPLDGELVVIDRTMALPASPDNPRQPRFVTVTGSDVWRESRTPNGDNARFEVRSVGFVTATSTTGRFFARAELRTAQNESVVQDANRWVNSGQTAFSSTSWNMGPQVAQWVARIFFGS